MSKWKYAGYAALAAAGGIATSEFLLRSERKAKGADFDLDVLIDVPGDQTGHTFVLFHGYPDDVHLWESTVKHLVARGHKCIRVALPGFPGPDGTIQGERRWGYEFDECMDLMERAMSSHLEDTEDFGIIMHDWGSVLGHMLLARDFLRPSPVWRARLKRVVAVDVGLIAKPKLILILGGILYQGLNNIAFMLPEFAGNAVGMFCRNVVMKAADYPGQAPFTAAMAWPYRTLWAGLASAEGMERAGNMYDMDISGIPWLFIAKSTPRVDFFDDGYLKKVVESHPASSYVRIPKTEHWMMIRAFEKYVAPLDAFLVAADDESAKL